MLPTGHIATGALLGAWRSRGRGQAPAPAIAAGIAVAVLPDADILLPTVLDRLGVDHRLNSGVHHRWVTHTPLFWGLVALSARRLARRPQAPSWAPDAAKMLAIGVALHLAEDATANTVSLLWPLRRREYGLSLDRMPDVTDHGDYIRRYPFSPAGLLEAALIAWAFLACRRRLS